MSDRPMYKLAVWSHTVGRHRPITSMVSADPDYLRRVAESKVAYYGSDYTFDIVRDDDARAASSYLRPAEDDLPPPNRDASVWA